MGEGRPVKTCQQLVLQTLLVCSQQIRITFLKNAPLCLYHPRLLVAQMYSMRSSGSALRSAGCSVVGFCCRFSAAVFIFPTICFYVMLEKTKNEQRFDHSEQSGMPTSIPAFLLCLRNCSDLEVNVQLWINRLRTCKDPSQSLSLGKQGGCVIVLPHIVL